MAASACANTRKGILQVDALHEVLITRGAVIDGTGAPRFAADVAIDAGRITAIGDLTGATAKTCVDATDRVIAPGFIDVHNHSDGWLHLSQNLAAKTAQGYTTEILQSDGLGYAPLGADEVDEWFHYLRTLDGLPPERYSGWRSIADYLEVLDRSTAQNVAVQIPYANLRVTACGWGRSYADDSQIQIMRRLVEQGLDEGAVALSTGLDYVAECFASTEEIARVVAPLGAASAPYVTHIRYKSGLFEGLDEAALIASAAGCPLHVSHLKPLAADQSERLMRWIDQQHQSEAAFSYDLYPYLPGSTMLASLLPYEVWEDGPQAVAGKLADSGLQRRFDILLNSHRASVENIRIAWVDGDAGAESIGKTLPEWAEYRGLPIAEAVCDLLERSHLAALGVFEIGDDRRAHPFLSHPAQMVGSDGIFAPAGRVHPRAYGTAPRVLGPLVREYELFSLETAVHKMSGYPAQVFQLADRGVLREGAWADVVVFDPRTVHDTATYEKPQQRPVGVDHVFVNGIAVIQDGEPIDSFSTPPGRAVRRGEASVP